MSPASPDELTKSRVSVLAYPVPTTGRYLVFLLALLTSGLFVGTWTHNQAAGDAWADSVLACQSAAGRVSGGKRPAGGDATRRVPAGLPSSVRQPGLEHGCIRCLA